METYGTMFRHLCCNLAEKVDLDVFENEEDRAFFYNMFSTYLEIIQNYYLAKMEEVKASRKESLRLVREDSQQIK